MSSTTLVVALASFVASYAPDPLSWQADYGSAKRLGADGSRPLAVFIGSGKAGWNQVSRDGPLAKEAKQVLAQLDLWAPEQWPLRNPAFAKLRTGALCPPGSNLRRTKRQFQIWLPTLSVGSTLLHRCRTRWW